MGNRDSTRRRGHQPRQLVEEARCFNLLDRRWKEILCLRQASGTLQWGSPGSLVPKEWVDFHLSPVEPDGTRVLVLDFTRDPNEPKEQLILEEVRVGFSQRWHAPCPGGCDRLVRKLYLVEDGAVACWRCAGLQYRSAQKHDCEITDLAGHPVIVMIQGEPEDRSDRVSARNQTKEEGY
jgi:hypothetical protein